MGATGAGVASAADAEADDDDAAEDSARRTELMPAPLRHGAIALTAAAREGAATKVDREEYERNKGALLLLAMSPLAVAAVRSPATATMLRGAMAALMALADLAAMRADFNTVFMRGRGGGGGGNCSLLDFISSRRQRPNKADQSTKT